MGCAFFWAEPASRVFFLGPRRSSGPSWPCSCTPSSATARCWSSSTPPPPTASRGRSSPGRRLPSRSPCGCCATPPATSTSTTNPRGPWWPSSPSGAPASQAPMTSPGVPTTCCAGRPRRPSRRHTWPWGTGSTPACSDPGGLAVPLHAVTLGTAATAAPAALALLTPHLPLLAPEKKTNKKSC
ncbi:hypothetical protein RLOC_00013577 [Lonchura striata]|uniref:Uncharacterized protein n=1 Tax=Lonchura striata TaxID=40157 RepID=A0A218U6L6_9PASE|nr:hypothetical protein RLOC_00013577 [Lonchura striata domestica]